VYARKPSERSPQSEEELQQHVCDPATGFDSKGGQCLRIATCDKSVPGQQFERYPCSHWHRENPAAASDSNSSGARGGTPSLPADAECLSYKLETGTRRWLNAELWGEPTCQTENGPLISFAEFVWPVYGGAVCGRNQFFAFSGGDNDSSGTIRNNITDKCLTYDADGKFGSLEPCVGEGAAHAALASRQQWAVPALGSMGPIRLLNGHHGSSSESRTELCLDATAPPPPPSIHPGRPADAVGEPLAFIDAVRNGAFSFSLLIS
jgi:hypothetical protein